jgi:hypothetical protein
VPGSREPTELEQRRVELMDAIEEYRKEIRHKQALAAAPAQWMEEKKACIVRACPDLPERNRQLALLDELYLRRVSESWAELIGKMADKVQDSRLRLLATWGVKWPRGSSLAETNGTLVIANTEDYQATIRDLLTSPPSAATPPGNSASARISDR